MRLPVGVGGFGKKAEFSRLKRLGNQARDAKQWRDATEHYDRALALKPDAFEVWVQLGHSRKELGALDGAAVAYYQAEKLRPDDVDLQVQLGHLHNVRGEEARALARYEEAFRRGSTDDAALFYVRQASGVQRADRLDQDATSAPSDASGRGVPIFYFDYSDLILHFRRNRFPTGIQRVQVELFKASMDWEGLAEIRSCAYSGSIETWTDIDPLAFRRLCEMASDGGSQDDPTWAAASRSFIETLERQGPSRLPFDATLVNVGTSWWMPNYMQLVRTAKARSRLRYVPLVFDLVPMLHPELLDGDFGPVFNAWLSGVFLQADATAVISSNTASDLIQASTKVKRLSVEPVVVPLNAEFRAPGADHGDRSNDATVLERFGFVDRSFVLFVGTFEVRKNHQVVFQAWLRLLEQNGASRVPVLVCVGKQGWRFEDAAALLSAHADLRAKVVLLSGVSDTELRTLFGRCMFTVYASVYEGWGLPVTESLAHGRACLTANNSSLPEAGGRFADYYETGSVASLADAAHRLIFDQAYREEREALIEAEYRSRSWTDLLDTMVRGLLATVVAKPLMASYAAPIALGVVYPVAVQLDLRQPTASAAISEMLRSGQTWHEMEEWGTWASGLVGRLSFAAPDGPPTDLETMLYLRVRTSSEAVILTVQLEATIVTRVRLVKYERRLLSLALPADVLMAVRATARPATLSLRVDGLANVEVYGRTRPVGIGIESFALCRTSDAAERLDVLERCWMRVAPIDNQAHAA